MAAVRLPDAPSLEQLRKQAKDLRDQAREGVASALDLVGAHHPGGPHPPSLAGAQLVVARHYGFASWAVLKRYVEAFERYRRAPDQADGSGTAADEFLVHACLRYGRDDGPSRWQRAAGLLAAHPEITRTSVHAAAAAADTGALTVLLAEDPALAGAEGGPFGWEPVLYLAYARHDPAISQSATLQAARLLLEHGADPNAGYLWHGMTTAFTALTGTLGNGGGSQPAHPHGLALARTLLAAGADPNDGQALYNRQFGSDDSHLALLLEHGLGRGDGGPWRARLGAAAPSPADLIAGQLWWAVVHDMPARVRLLAGHGAGLLGPFEFPDEDPVYLHAWHGKTPVQTAALCGCLHVLGYLVEHGAPRPRMRAPTGSSPPPWPGTA
jgi:hypothetical protein